MRLLKLKRETRLIFIYLHLLKSNHNVVVAFKFILLNNPGTLQVLLRLFSFSQSKQ